MDGLYRIVGHYLDFHHLHLDRHLQFVSSNKLKKEKLNADAPLIL